MVVNDKAMVREMKEAYKGWGYTVMRTKDDQWVIGSKNAWTVAIDGQINVPNEVMALIVLHMGKLPEPEQCWRIYKEEKSTCIQKEVYKVALDDFARLEDDWAGEKEEVRRTALIYGRCRVWQRMGDKGIALIDPKFEGLMDIGGDSVVYSTEEHIYLGGEISRVYISRIRGGDRKQLLEHLAKVDWT